MVKKSFIAHVQKNSDGLNEQTVVEHSLNSSYIAAMLGKNVGLINLSKLGGLFHDIGKMTDEFDDYIHDNKKNYKRGEIDHSYAGAKFIYEFGKSMGKEYDEMSRLVARTIISHHGLHDWIDEKGNDYFLSRVAKTEGYQTVLEHVNEIIDEASLKELMQRAHEEYCRVHNQIEMTSLHCQKKENAKSFYMGMFERYLQSVVMEADVSDTIRFEEQREIIFVDSKSLFWAFSDMIRVKTNELRKKTDKISLIRGEISDKCAQHAQNKVGICRMTVPTGGGKTLSSLRFAIENGRKMGKDRIIYVAPFMSILEQNSGVIREIVGEENFLEHHSNMISYINDNGSEEDLKKYERYTENWDMPVIATTMVQFLNTLFLDKKDSVRRFNKLANSVIVIDEIQSLPVKCVHLFNLAMNFLKFVLNCTVVLSSATQPNLLKFKYPLMLDEDADMVKGYEKYFDTLKRTKMVPCLKKNGYTYEEAAEFSYEKFVQHRKLMIVVNTKTAAREMFDLISRMANDRSDDVRIIHLSTSMCPKHRRDRIDELKKLLKCQEVICVTTQLIEAGVDISFNAAVRFVAGMENHAQAAGRVNRNGELSEMAPIYIIDVKEESLGSLKEIKQAQGITKNYLRNGNTENKDFLSPDIMEAYFERLFEENKNELSCYIKDKRTTILEMLSLNSESWKVYRNPQNKYCGQAFKTAGEFFKVIEDNTIGVVVPYDEEAERLIAKLETIGEGKIELSILRGAQKYTVNLYENALREFEHEHVIRQLPCGVWVLDKVYYSGEYGIDVRKQEMDLLMF